MTPRNRSVFALSMGALSLLAALFLGACGKKTGGVAGPGPAIGTLTGQVTLAGTVGSPVVGATVTASTGASAVTNASGQFTLSIPANQNVRVDVTKANFTLNQLQVRLAADEARAVTVGLMAAGNTAAVPVGSGGSVTDPSSNARIALPPNFVTASGPVTVTITGLDPTTDQIKALPGGLQAVDGSGATKYLKPVSFAEYTARDASGNVLQFNNAASAGANIELPVPASLQGQPGYANGDPIECYVYDPADGKWKTPVPGVIGPSSVNGQPAIKATIFHLSWYGGAPATDDVACIHGTVRDSLGAPLAGVNVEAFQGNRTTTDASGNYQVQAAAHSQVRVVASRALSGSFQSAADTVQTGGALDPCALVNLVMRSRRASYNVTAEITAFSFNGQSTAFAYVQIMVGVEGDEVPVSGATVEIGSGSSFTTIPENGSTGEYAVSPLTPGYETFTLDPGVLYTLRLDYNHDGVVDATGQVRMAGQPIITTPAEASVQGATFTAAWTDAGSVVVGYNPLYIGINAGADSASVATIFFTTARSKVIGSGVVDPITSLPDPPLAADTYSLSVFSAVGPFTDGFGLPNVPTSPNIAGPGTSGYFFSFQFSDPVIYNSTGAAPVASNTRVSPPAAEGLSAARANAAFRKEHLRLRIPESRISEWLSRAKREGRMATRHTR